MTETAKILLIALLSVVTVGAQTSVPFAPVLFIREYSNYAWGHQDGGWFIDSTGAFFTFNLQKDSVWTLSNSDSLTPQQMQHMHELAAPSDKKIPLDTIQKMAALIQPSRNGIISRFDNGCRDFGGVSYRAYYFDDSSTLYRTVYLFEFGDGGLRNSSPAAIALAQWLVYTIDSVTDNTPCLTPPAASVAVPPQENRSQRLMMSALKTINAGRVYDIRGRLVPTAASVHERLKPGIYYVRNRDGWARIIAP
jgi:hypothetical protein